MAVAGLVCLQSSLTAAQSKKPASKYAVYQSQIDSFTVEVPAAYKNFTMDKTSFDTKLGKREMHIYKSTTKNTGYFITALDFGIASISDKDVRMLLESARKAVEARGEVLSKGETKIGGVRALTIRDKIKVGDQIVYTNTAFFYIGAIQFQMSFMSTDQNQVVGKDIQHFFSSFKRTKM